MAKGKTGVDARMTLLAIKAILLAPGFNETERRLAGALFEHFNRNTGQCDPSLDRLAKLLDKDVRTIERAAKGLARKGVVRFFRHGGRSNRNSYEPIWERLKKLEQEWRTKFEAAARQRRSGLSSPTRNSSPVLGDANVDQTDSKNLLSQTYSMPGRKERPNSTPRTSSYEAARAAARRRLSEQLRASCPSAADYVSAMADIDDDTWDAFIEAECLRHGAGAELLSDWLQGNERS